MALEIPMVTIAAIALAAGLIALVVPGFLLVAYCCPKTKIGKFMRNPFAEGSPGAHDLEAAGENAARVAEAAQAQIHPAIRTAVAVERLVVLLERIAPALPPENNDAG